MADFFIIKSLPTRANLLFDGIPVVLNQKYPLLEENKFSIQNISGYKGQPLDSFTYNAEVDGVISQNIATVAINFPSSDCVPEKKDVIKNIFINTQINFSDDVSYENCFDRVVITSITGKGNWTRNSEPVLVGEEVFAYNFFQNMKFVASDDGAESNYNILKFKFAKAGYVFPDENTFTINTSSIAEINSDNYVVNVEDEEIDGIFKKIVKFSIDRNLVGSATKLNINANINDFSLEPTNNFKVNNETEVTTETFTLEGDHEYNFTSSSVNGIETFLILITKELYFKPGDFLTVTLVSVNGNPALVNPVKKEIIFNLE